MREPIIMGFSRCIGQGVWAFFGLTILTMILSFILGFPFG
jgi:hypothetical protein